MESGQVFLDVFLGDAGLAFLGHRAPGPASEKKEKKEKNKVVPEGCCPQCFYAHPGTPCRCRCRGAFHGHGNRLLNNGLDEYAGYEAVTEKAILEIFEDADCLVCGHNLSDAPVYGYEHPDGVNVDGRRLWVFAVCPRCGYQNSLAKIVALKKQANPWVDGEVDA